MNTVDIQKPRLGWSTMANELRSSTPSKNNHTGSSSSIVSINRGSSDVDSMLRDGQRTSSSRSRKDSIQMFSEAAVSGQIQKKMALQGKLFQLKAQTRKESFLKEGGIKKVMVAPTVMRAFRRNVSVSI